MATFKAGSSGSSHASLARVVSYVLNEDKIPDGILWFEGPFGHDVINEKNVCQAFIDEKKLWANDAGRMYSHFILSFHKDEKITKEDAMETAREIFGECFGGHQFLLVLHTDKPHLHIHAVVNTVSFENGKKLHTSASDLENYKKICNGICLKRGLTVPKKGQHFDGKPFDNAEFTSWNKTSYNIVMHHPERSFKYRCMKTVMKSRKKARSREEFIRLMNMSGWNVNWSDNRRYITFSDDKGHRIRDITLSKELEQEISKEALENEFERNKYGRNTETDEYSSSENGERNEKESHIENGEYIAGGIRYFSGTGASNEASQSERKVEAGAGEWTFEGGSGSVISEILRAGRNLEEAFGADRTAGNGNLQPAQGKSDRKQKRKLAPGEKPEGESFGIQM